MNTIELLTINSIFFISYKLFSSYFNKNISEERIKWREKIREITIKIVTMDKENAEKNKDEFIAELAI